MIFVHEQTSNQHILTILRLLRSQRQLLLHPFVCNGARAFDATDKEGESHVNRDSSSCLLESAQIHL
jgi:hypothetical protein